MLLRARSSTRQIEACGTLATIGLVSWHLPTHLRNTFICSTSIGILAMLHTTYQSEAETSKKGLRTPVIGAIGGS